MADNNFSAYRTLRPGVARVEAQLQDFSFPVHSHEHVCIGLMWDGEISSRDGLHRRIVCKGDVLLVNPGEVHDGRPSGWCGRQYSMLEINTGTFQRICLDALGRERVEFQQPILRNPKVRGALAVWLASLSGTDAPVELEAVTMLFGLLSEKVDRPCTRRAASELAAKVSHRMREIGKEDDGVCSLAVEVGASRYQIIRAFKQAFGLTPEDFRRQLRVERARSLLAGCHGLADISAAAGFADQSHMTREFRRLVGLTPSAYRRALQ